MAKYNYDKTVLKGLGVGPFLNEVKVRNAEIEKAPDTMPVSVYNANLLAQKLHPHFQIGVITEVKEHKGAKTFVIAPDTTCGQKQLAYFRAGQFVSFALNIGESKLCKPYTLCSSPKEALGETGNTYAVTVKAGGGNFAGSYVLENWKVGTQLILSAPLGNFYYTRLRDAKTVVALAGGSGITPFLSMARAIADGIEDFNLTILYGSRTRESILLKEELEDAVKRSGGKVKVIHVLSDEAADGTPVKAPGGAAVKASGRAAVKAPGGAAGAADGEVLTAASGEALTVAPASAAENFEHGFLTAELIRKYAPKADFSIFACGPKAMYQFLEKETAKLGLPRRLIRFEVGGSYGDPTSDAAYPKEKAGQQYKLHVLVRGEEYDLMTDAAEPLITACEKAGIRVPSDCRSGKCGWCHSRLISGEVYVPESADGRRAADKKFGWIHPCVSYALSDVSMEVFPMLE